MCIRDRLLSDVNEMQKMLENYLDFAEDVTREKAIKTDLKQMIKEIINSESIENKVIEFNVKNDKTIFFECRAIAM